MSIKPAYTVGIADNDAISSDSDVIFFDISEDSYQGDAQFTVSVDNVQIGGIQTATASHAAADSQLFDVLGSFGPGVHSLTINFLNDLYAGTPATDRNLYVDGASVDGSAIVNGSLTEMSGGPQTLFFSTAPSSIPLGGTGGDTVSVSISEDAWEGDAEFQLTLDGVAVGGVQTADVLHSSGASDMLTFNAAVSSGPHELGVQFLNDAYGGSSATDRNLYVDSVSVDGVDQSAKAALDSNGTSTFSILAPSGAAGIQLGSGQQAIELVLSEDAYLGNAEFTVTVDGTQVGGVMGVGASHAAGQHDDFTIRGDFGAGPHTVSVAFINDAYGGNTALDRNLYVDGISLDGVQELGATQVLDSNGAATVQGSFAGAPISVAPNPAPTPVPTPPAPVSATPPTSVPLTAGASSDIGLIPVMAPAYPAGSHVLTVGAGKDFTTIAAAVQASQNGDVILVDAGTYTNDFAVVNASISLIAVGGRVTMNATVPPPNFKGILTEEADLKVVGFDFTNSRIPDEEGHNGAGIRVDNGNLILDNDSFIGNQDGLLTNGGAGISVTMDHDLFDDNGGNDGNGAGNIHNVYIGDVAFATVTNSLFENAQVGHEFKSRAELNTLTNNEFVSGVGIGTGSYDIDLPNGGKDTITGNTIVKGPNSENDAMVHFGGEGIPYAGSSLTVSDNIFDARTNASATGVLNQTAISVTVTGNELEGLAPSSLEAGPATLTGNYDATGMLLPNGALTGVLPGSTTVFTDGASHAVTLGGNTPVDALEGGAGLLTVDVAKGHVIVIGGSGGLDLTEDNATGTGGNQYTTAAGSTNMLTIGDGMNIIDSEGNDTIVTGNGNNTGNLNGMSALVEGNGSNSWSVNGTAAITTASGSTFLNLGVTGNLALLGGGAPGDTSDYWALGSNGGNLTFNTLNDGAQVTGSIDGGAYSMQVYGGQARIQTSGGSTGANINIQSGNLLLQSVGPDLVHLGSGDSDVIVRGAAQVYAGTGRVELFGHSDAGGADFFGNGGDYTIGGDTGGITYHGGDADSTVEVDLSKIALVGGVGHLTIDGGSDEAVTGGIGGVTWNDEQGGANTVTTLAGSSSLLNLEGSDTVNSYGNDTIAQGTGNTNISVFGNSSLSVADGNSQFTLGGTDSVSVAAGHDTFQVLAGAHATMSLVGLHTIHEQDATVGVAFTNASGQRAYAKIQGGTADIATDPANAVNVTTYEGNSSANITLGAGSSSVDIGSADEVHLGSGSAYVQINGSGSNVWAGLGHAEVDNWASIGTFTLHGSTGDIDVQSGNGMTFIGGAGNATLAGSIADVVGGSGNISTIAASYGQDIRSFVGGSGNANLNVGGNGFDATFGSGAAEIHLLGWGAANTFNFSASPGGNDTIENFRLGTDRLVLGGDVSVTHQTVSGSSAAVSLSNGTELTLTGLSGTGVLFG